MNCAPSSVTLIDAKVIPTRGSLSTSPAPAQTARTETPFLTVLTFVLWTCCAVVGGVGLTLPYSRPLPEAPIITPIHAATLAVSLTTDVLPLHGPAPLAADAQIASSFEMEPVPAPPAATPLPLVEPGPTVAFALPVDVLAPIVELEFAAPGSAASPPAMPSPVLHVLDYGRGEGRQPAPVYPREAARERQEGIVTVRFSVGENGRVLAAETVMPAPWALLNSAALRAIKERWRFRPGARRLYEVTIRFELKD